MRRFVTYGPALVVLGAVVIALAAAPAAIREAQTARIQANVSLAQASLDQSNLLEQINEEVRSIAESTMPGVVHIESRGSGNRSNGAGWFWDESGHIITNAHVVGGSGGARVELHDGRVMRARLVGRDVFTDIAVLKVNPGAGVFPLRRGTDVPVHLGDRVYAFGSPFSIKFSMSEGIVSGLGRGEAAGMVGIQDGYTNFIQTDAAMNPGNSGGPLVDVNGRVIGMNTAIANAVEQMGTANSGQSAGIGFAIPLETVESVVDQLIDQKIVLRGFLGITLRDLQPGDIDEIGFEGNGVLVIDANEDQPAAKAGLQAGDVITAVDGRETPNSAVLRSVVSVQEPGAEVEVEFWREGEFMVTTVRLGAARMVERREGRFTVSVPEYIEGSEDMTEEEIREMIGG